MMEPEQRTKREITYQVGWKRGKIKLNKEHCVDRDAESAEQFLSDKEEGLSRIEDWNLRWIWRPAGLLREEAFQVLLWIFPFIGFGISIWLIYQLSLNS